MSLIASKTRKHAGFSLIELMIAMSVFLVIGGTAMTLFRQNTNLFTDQQGTTALNITMRNALTQIQNDVVNAASGYYNGTSSSVGWPFGISAVNATPGYDTLNVFVPAIAPAAMPAGGCINTQTGSGTVVPPRGTTSAAYAPSFTAGSEILILNTTGNQFTTAMLNSAIVAGANVTLNFTPTQADGRWQASASYPTDPLNISNNLMPPLATDTLSSFLCGGWVIPLKTTTYSVDGTNQLYRQLAGAGQDVIADQIIGFKVGVSQFTQTAGGATSGQYWYDNSYLTRYIRSVRVSVIGRTPPNQWSGSNFANTFDGGKYKIEALSLVINPRNLSMNDCGTCN
jgi:prepilin-type N-terminal cleavage/methylation domain-containing protein